MELIITAVAATVLILSVVGAAMFQSRRRGRAESEIHHEKYKAEETEEILDDVRVANAARDDLRSDAGERQRLRSESKYNRDKD